MLIDPMGGIVLTNDGHAILREIDVSHPAAKALLDLCRAQDEEVGDGTTSVIILAGEILKIAEPFLLEKMHPTKIINGFKLALQAIEDKCNSMAVKINADSIEELEGVVHATLGTKLASTWAKNLVQIAVNAVKKITVEGHGKKEIDIKRFAKVEKIPGGSLEEIRVLDGVMFNKDVIHPKMARKIKDPRVMLLDCTLEYKKSESTANVEITTEEDFTRLLELEEEHIKSMCNSILALKPNVLITEKGVADLAAHYLMKGGVTVLRRLRKTDNIRVAKATGATIAHRVDELTESHIGCQAGLFEVRKIGDEYFSFIEECKNPKACTVLLRGASKDILNELERNLQDAMQVARNILLEPRLLPGGGSTEMACAQHLIATADSITGEQQFPYKALAEALEVIPRVLAKNCGSDVIRVITSLRAKHAAGETFTGVDGVSGELKDMADVILEPYAVKVQGFKIAVEAACMLLRIDDIISGVSQK
eukprot:TRINITY_DN523_c0_g2_i1.p1 TRINITY_DN523_c0_g2~~TRINITY_DN523_c0_g2_i1.p1  ORF type:complete len:543 (+),score=224.55 TRINITY_DN523_c0_g2_i1:191-1630(+)